jgi:type IV pilus assembly protein PilB
MTPERSDGYPRVPFLAEDVDHAAYAAHREVCLRHGFLPTFSHGMLLDVAMLSPADESSVRALRHATRREVRRFGIAEEDFDRAVAALEGRPGAPDGPSEAPPEGLPPRWPESWDFHARGAREIAAGIVSLAFEVRASDILLDEQEDWMEAALKVAGRKEMLPPVERAAAPALLKAFKEIAGLPTGAAMTWQSGAASLRTAGGHWADLRIEISPTVHGESMVARVQDRELQLRRMRRLPFPDPRQIQTATACLRQAQGVIVATGPTGSGKTTTLYACLGQLDSSELNIRTLEDPVEFVVPGIAQIPVGAGTGRSFESGLKSLLRQAPDVILLGEIRDRAAAQICIEAVDTGHLILTTLHTRDAIGVVARLMDLGLSGRPIASSLLLVIAQRLVGRLCPACRRAAPVTAAQAAHFEHHRLPRPAELFEPVGCALCGETGRRGSAALFEFFQPSAFEDIDGMIRRSDNASLDERALRDRWIELGGSPLAREGLKLAASGGASYSDILRLEPNAAGGPG